MDEASSRSMITARRKGCGRRRIEIKKIENQRKRWVAFSKRKKGLLNKAAQLSRLSGEEIGVIIISEQGRVYTSENADAVVHRFLSQEIVEDDNDNDHDHDDDDGKAGNVFKIKDGDQSLEQVHEYGDELLRLKKNVEGRMKEIKGKNCLIDLNKDPGRSFLESSKDL